VLSALAVSAAITAMIAGITGAWSPCGFSMVETIGSALGDARRIATLTASLTFAAGALIGGAVTFGGLALLGNLIDPGASGLRYALGAAVALAGAIADWRGVRIAPQIRRQVPERWRWSAPLSLACGLYGVLLGLAFTTFVLSFAVWALAGVSFAAGDPALGVLVGVAFGLGRALPVLWIAPRLGSGGARQLDGMASEPRMWLGLRRLDALGLSLCALFLSGASATAAVPAGASDPSAGAGGLVWQQVASGQGALQAPSGQISTLPGGHPALGGSLIAWAGAEQVTVADLASMSPRATFPVAHANALALSQSWLVYRAQGPAGEERLIGISLLGSPAQTYIAGSTLAGELGRPSLDGSEVVFSVDTPNSDAIVMMNLATGARRILRFSRRRYALMNPSELGGQLLYERVDRCSQQLRIGPLGGGGSERVLISLPSTVQRDPGYQRGYTHAYNTASLCPNRGTGAGATTELGATALGPAGAYVTEVPSNPDAARIVSLSPLPPPPRGHAGGGRIARAAWQPGVRAAIAYAHTRAGEVSFAVRSGDRLWGWRALRTVPSASVLKAMLLVAYLDDPRVRGRALGSADRRLIDPMIQRSDNLAATRVLTFVGARGVDAVARRAGMRRFTLDPLVWGLSRIDADDQARFFLHIDRDIVARHRAAAMHLLASVTPSQRWGIGQLRLPGFKLYFKGGWGSGTGAVEHQVALLQAGPIRVALAVLITASPSHAYAKRTLRGVFQALLRGVGGLL
jgi:hypothetical protein